MKKILNGLAAIGLVLAGTAGAALAAAGAQRRRADALPDPQAQGDGLVVRRAFRHLRQGPAPARPEGLQGSLLGLPLDGPRGVPHARRTSATRKRRSRRLPPSTKSRTAPTPTARCSTRKALPSDHFPSPFPNAIAAAAANNGAAPPDFSLIAKARGVERGFPTFVFDIFTQYAEGGPDYIHSLLTGYDEQPPAGMEVAEGTHYNPYFIAGKSLAMAKPLSDGQVTYDDGAPETVDQYSTRRLGVPDVGSRAASRGAQADRLRGHGLPGAVRRPGLRSPSARSGPTSRTERGLPQRIWKGRRKAPFSFAAGRRACMT